MPLFQKDSDDMRGLAVSLPIMPALVVLACIGVAGAGIAAMHARAAATPDTAANPPVTVSVAPVAFQSAYETEDRYTGRIESTRRTPLGFELQGLVTDVFVDEGDRVEAGDPIAALDTDRLISVRDSLMAEREQTEARRDLARATLQRQRELRTEGWQTEQRYDEARFLVAELTASIKRTEASIESITIDIDKSTIFAPYDGIVGRRHVDEGTVVSPGATIVDLLETGSKQARIGVPVDAADALTVGAAYTLAVGNRPLAAVLVSKRPDLQTGTLTVSAVFEITGTASVFDGDVVSLTLPRTNAARGLWLPVSALNEGRKGVWTVFVVTPDDGSDVVRREAVEILGLRGEDVFVHGTLQNGDNVVLSGTHRIVPGQRVIVSSGAQ